MLSICIHFHITITLELLWLMFFSDSLHTSATGSSAYLLGEGQDVGEEPPATPLPLFIQEWLAIFTSWPAEHKAMALNGLISA